MAANQTAVEIKRRDGHMVWKGGETALYGVVNKASVGGRPDTGEVSRYRIKADRNALIHHRSLVHPYLRLFSSKYCNMIIILIAVWSLFFKFFLKMTSTHIPSLLLNDSKIALLLDYDQMIQSALAIQYKTSETQKNAQNSTLSLKKTMVLLYKKKSYIMLQHSHLLMNKRQMQIVSVWHL